MDIETKIKLVKRKPTEEVLTEAELRQLLETEARPRHYIGFEISGKVHLGTGLLTALKIRDFIEAGIKPTIFLADYHAWINNKLGGDLDAIQRIAKGYFKHAFVSLGLDEGKVDYVLASEIYDADYWRSVLSIAKRTTLKRIMRTITAMGRKEEDVKESAFLIYPAMQVADIFRLQARIAHAGMDQRKVHVLARELAASLRFFKPIAVHSHLLMGLKGPQKMGFDANAALDVEISSKMSKSIEGSCIYIHDGEAEIAAKIAKAYCPERQVEGNPLIETCEHALMRNAPLRIERSAKFGGDVEFASADELKRAFAEGALHPLDLKNAVARELAALLKPSRDYFAKRPELLEQISGAEITR
jgi:tyrosyl-tRNA synthetase